MKDTVYDVAVVGGGPAGMMAAGRAAELGARVVLLEKNPTLGKKLLITGGGRCNITNAEFDVRKLVEKYGRKGKALFGSFSRFGVEDTIRFFESRGLPIKVESEKRAFPVSNRAEDVWKIMVEYLRAGKVDIRYNSEAVGFGAHKGAMTRVQLKKGEVRALRYVVAAGGRSRPETGSSGEAAGYLERLGLDVQAPDLALVPVKIREQWVKDLSGISFPAAKISIYQDGKIQDSRIGKILFTHFGLSGPLVLNMSRAIAELFKYAPVELHADLFPSMDTGGTDAKALEIFKKNANKKIKNSLGEIIPPRMVACVLHLCGIDPEKEVNVITREERQKIVRMAKDLPMSVEGFLGMEKAVVTSGGVSLGEIDFRTMRCKKIGNLYLAGDILNFDRPSGGFSLQICWTTGYLAGENSAQA